MFQHQQFSCQQLTSPDASWVPQAPPSSNRVIWLTSCACTAPEPLCSTADRPPICIPMKQFRPAAEQCRSAVAGIAKFLLIPEISCIEDNTDYESNDRLDIGGAKHTAAISLKQKELSFKQFANSMGKPNFLTFNKWKTVWVAGCLEKMHWCIIKWQNHQK